MTETSCYEPTRLSIPPKPLFSLKPEDKNSEDKNSALKTAASFELIFPVAEPPYNRKSLYNHDRDQLL